MDAAAPQTGNAVTYLDADIETAPRARIRRAQLEKLKKQVAWAYARVPWYQQRFQELGVRPEDIQSLEDARLLPFTDKQTLRDTYPFGLCAIPLDEVVRLHASSGTTGKPIVIGYSRRDLETWSDCVARLVTMAGVTRADRVQMAFGYGMFTGGFGLHYGCEKLGCMMVPAGSGNTERHLMMIEDYKTTVLISTPSYAMHMCEVGEALGFDWKSASLRVGLFGGEPCTLGMKREIESRMHIVCTDNYGLTEVNGPGVAGECLSSCEYQHIAEDHFLWEVIDPHTGEVLPEGREGELVLTLLDKEAFPMLRYRTRDLTRVITEPCACGRTHARMAKVRARTDDMLIVRGTNIFPSQVEDALSGIERLTPHYRITLDNETGMDRMTVMVELRPEAFSDSFEEMDRFRRHVVDRLKQSLMMTPVVKLVEPGGIERSFGKSRRVEDRRRKA
ncbi:MAG: phenylacetate--CoA ligase [Zoogloeaceae bacterium]|jgi:phenylacetate-CoA ligase|nr:phenylacetate--CoA ligase [Zoogloeaceae bacterium]